MKAIEAKRMVQAVVVLACQCTAQVAILQVGLHLGFILFPSENCLGT